MDLSPLDSTIQKIDKVYIDPSAENSEISMRVQKFFPNEKIEFLPEDELYPDAKGTLSAREFDRSKKELLITEHKGSFFKRCPGARPGLTCCNYFVLNLGLQCDMNCSYCYLQSFINSPVMKVYSNIDKAIDELHKIAAEGKDFQYRVGTGEVIDSLSLDDLTLFSRKLISAFREWPKWRLEFKTKSDQVDQFLDMDHAGNTIVSWSINPQNIIETEEHGTASLENRLKAAKKCLDVNHKIAFHIDPIIWHPEWKFNYGKLVKEIVENFSPQDIPYISVGALRFQPEQRHIMRDRFGMNSWVTRAEVFKSKDGKLRYDNGLRKEMYEFVIKEFKKRSDKWNIFMCMESPETWLSTTNQMPKKDEGLKELFNFNVIKNFNSRSNGSENQLY